MDFFHPASLHLSCLQFVPSRLLFAEPFDYGVLVGISGTKVSGCIDRLWHECLTLMDAVRHKISREKVRQMDVARTENESL